MKQRTNFVTIPRRAAGATGIVLLTLFTRRLFADEPYSTDPCPSREAITAAVNALLVRSSILPEDLGHIDIEDFGEQYVVSVKEQTREYTDITRDCAKRARVAAVFVALTLSPPDIKLPQASEDTSELPQDVTAPRNSFADRATTAKTPTPSSPAPIAPKSRQWFPRAELGEKVELPVQPNHTLINWSGHIRLILSSPNWGTTAGVAAPEKKYLSGPVNSRTAGTLHERSIRENQLELRPYTRNS